VLRCFKQNPDDWGRPDGRTPQGSCLAISAHLSREERGSHHHVDAAKRWCLPLLIGHFPNRFPVGPYPPLRGPSVSPTKVLLGYLESFRLPLLPCSSKLRSPKLEQHSPLLMFPAHWTITKITIYSIHSRYSLWRRNLSHNSLPSQIPSVSS